MKKTQRRDLVTTIKGTFISFFSILMFVALGVGVFLGIIWSGPALEGAAERVFEEGNFHNFQIQFPYGLTDSDLQQLSQVDGVTQIEPAFQSFQTVKVEGENVTVKVTSLGTHINVPVVVEGKIPSNPNQIAINYEAAETLGVGVGDTLAFQRDSDEDPLLDPEVDDGMGYLRSSTYEVCGLVHSAEYISVAPDTYGISQSPSGMVDALAWVTPEAFDAEQYYDGYPIVNVTCQSLEGLSTYGDEYQKVSKEIESRIVELGDRLGTARYDSLHDNVQRILDDGRAKLNDAQAKIDKGKQDIADGEKKLEEGKKTLAQERAEGEAKLADAYEELMGYEDEFADAEAELEAAKDEVALAEDALAEADAAKAEIDAIIDEGYEFKAELDDELKRGEITQEEYDATLDAYGDVINDDIQPFAKEAGVSVPSLNHSNFATALSAARAASDHYEDIPITYEGQQYTVREARAKIAEANGEIDDAEAELEEKRAELDDGWDLYYAGQDELNQKVAEAEQELADGEAKLADARKQVADGEAQVEAKKPDLEQLEQVYDDMKPYYWAVLGRDVNAGSANISVFSAVTTNLSLSMALLFVVVGLLVSYSAVSRIVNERMTQIGAKKALGLRTKEITAGFLAYSGIAVIIGAILGALLGTFLVEGIIGGALGSMFTFGTFPPHFGILLFLIVTALELGLVLVCTWLACKKILRERAVVLLRGESTTQGKRRFFEDWAIWQKLPLFTQTIINNCLNEKRRVFSTIVGVAGCTALIVTAITLNDDVLKSYTEHYEDVYHFNVMAYVKPEPKGAINKVEDILKREGATTTQTVRKSIAFDYGDETRGVTQVYVPANEQEFAQVYSVNSVSDNSVDLSQDGVWVSQSLAEHAGAKVGDKINLYPDDGKTHEVPILGFYQFRLTYYEMVMGSDYYKKEFGEYIPNVVLANTGDVSVDDVHDEVMAVPGAYYIEDDKIEQRGNFDTFSTVSSAVVAIYLVLAILMALVMLLNLNIMCIEEKKRELIVLMINGFSVHDAKRYIYNDTIVLSILGILVGLLFGCLVGWLTVIAVEPETASFVKSIDLIAVLAGILGSALLSLIMSLIALRRIPRLDLTDINKT
ncbi:MAG: FtsX-like permease family protein [Coriobacteriales bacterium]|nr:FtsX-like permease family protein [Coriobacteriales bacterium]